MKRIAYALALTALASVSLAAMGTGSGLPASWTFLADRGYGTATISGTTANERNGASAMCVECHSVNPSHTVMQISDNGADTPTRNLATYGGSHFVINAAANANVFGTTNSGGGHASSFGGAARNGGEYFRGAAWTNGGNSKFGLGTNLTSVVELGAGFAVATADMICESCHSITQNVVTAADNDLLLGAYQDNVNDSLCTGCHAQDELAAGRQTFHTNDVLVAFDGVARKRHHVMTGDQIDPTSLVHYPANGISGVRWAPSFSAILGQDWCTPANKFITANRGAAETITGAVDVTFRNKCNIAGAGTVPDTQPELNGDINITSAANPVNCSNCHRPHNARTSAGGHLFRLGLTTAGDYNGNTTAGLFTTSDMYRGIRRQADVATGKVYGEYRPLCLGCHVGY